ncbi:unnamed protein product [Porites evermanni]|uniref:Transposase Helix-turn-helix domain-containing protein n=1 Tax=Porites evermanni TaxID=104178 RepID=A0ABN8RYQ1_9CNID|nr:unnamed protein product [Porites evermanni]
MGQAQHRLGTDFENLGKRDYKGNKRKEQTQKAAEDRAKRGKERRKHSIERKEVEVAEKRKHLNVSGDGVVDIHFTETSTITSTEEPSEASSSTTGTTSDAENHAEGSVSEPSKDAETQTEEFEYIVSEPSKDAETQTEEFEYMFYRPTYQAPDSEYFRSDDKVRSYTEIPSYQVLIATFNHVVPHVSHRTQALDPLQEFVLVLIKLRLNVPFKDLAYRFLVSVPTVSRIFFHG